MNDHSLKTIHHVRFYKIMTGARSGIASISCQS